MCWLHCSSLVCQTEHIQGFLCVTGIVFQIKHTVLDDGSEVYSMWVSRDPEEPAEMGRTYANLTLASSLNSTADRSFNLSLGEVGVLYLK